MRCTSLTYWLWRLIGRLAFNRVGVVGAGLLPDRGPILFVATHRNGALDAAPYNMAAPCAVPMVSAQLHRMPLGRLLFRGIAVSRSKDKARGIKADNSAAMKQCLELLRQGGRLLVMPEGTSSLGHGHLPFHRGAAKIAHAAMKAGMTPLIVPLGVHYEAPTQWQSRVEVLVGNPITPACADEASLHQLITAGLETVGANFPDEATQRMAERLAYACTLGTSDSYALTLKTFERQIPPELAAAAQELEQLSGAKRLALHQGVPLMPVGGMPLYALYWLFLLPAICAFSLLNAPVLAAAWIASRKLPDAPNVIAFWRMLIGLPVGCAWAALISGITLLLAQPLWALSYWLATAAGIYAWYRFRKLTVALHNGLFHADAKPALLRTYRSLLNRRQHVRPA